MKTIKIAMIGVGSISGIYLENITNTFKEIELIGVCDLIRDRAEKAKEKYQIPKIYDTMYDAFNDPDVDIVLNLTRPSEHFEVSKHALLAGKHVYSEKPLAACLDDGKALVALAQEQQLYLGGAPDTFLGAGIQTCRKLIDDGFIGTPIGSAAFMICHGHETWHPDPAFYYGFGGGPMMDMGPYYLTALVNLMGGFKEVMSASCTTFKERVITSEPLAGTVMNVTCPTHIAGTIRYQSGAIGTILTSFDVYYPTQARLEIYGTAGTLIVPDPNTFEGPVKLLRPEDGELKEMPLLFPYKENSRALGLADMAKAVQLARPARCDYQQTLHVLEAMANFEQSSQTNAWVPMTSVYEKRPPLVPSPLKGIIP